MGIPIALLIGSLVSAIVGAGVSSYSVNKTNQANRQLQEQANQFNAEQIANQNDYNAPSAQISRLMSAGLNPNLAYGSLDTSIQRSVAQQGSIPSQQAFDASPYAGQMQNSFSLANDLKNSESQRKLNESQQKFNEMHTKTEEKTLSLYDADIAVKLSQAGLTSAETTKVLTEIDNLKEMNLQIKANTELVHQQISAIAKDMKKTDAEIDAIVYDMVMKGKEFGLACKRLSLDASVARATIEKMQKEGNLLDVQRETADFKLNIDRKYSDIDRSLEQEKQRALIFKAWTDAEQEILTNSYGELGRKIGMGPLHHLQRSNDLKEHRGY